jgi:hypothetical protein
MPAGFNIAQFSSYINETGVLKTDKYLTRFTLPSAMARNINAFNTIRRLEFWCESSKIPGVQLNLHDVRRYGYGITEKKPTNAVFSDIPFLFIGDGNGEIWEFFHQWISLVNNFDLRDGISGTTTATTTQSPMELAYKYEYAVDMDVIAFDETGQEKIHIKLRDAFPFAIAPIDLAWASRNEIMKIPVIFTFTDWYNELVPTRFVDFNSLNNTNLTQG